jgi:hypothetical protein
MSVRQQKFTVAEILQVPANASLRGFPEFPCAGTLVVLSPAYQPAPHELNGYSAEIGVGAKVLTLRYAYWQVNSHGEIGLLGEPVDDTAIPLGSWVRFVPRTRAKR